MTITPSNEAPSIAVAEAQGEDISPLNMKYSWFVVFLLMVAYTLSFIDRQILSLLIGPLKKDLILTDIQIGLLQGFAFALFYTLMGIPCGRLVDKFNRKWLVTSGITLWSLMTVSCGFANSYLTLFLARMGVGVGEATLNPSAYSLISDFFPKEKLGKAMGFYSAGIYIGAGLAYILGGSVIALVEAFIGPILTITDGVTLKSWQITFIIVGVPGVLVAGVIAIFLKEPLRTGKFTSLGAGDNISFTDVLVFIWRDKKTFLPLFAGVSMISPLGYIILSWGPEFFIRTYGLSTANTGLIFGVIVMVFGSMGIIHGGIFADKLMGRGQGEGYFKVVSVGSFILMVPVILFPLAGSATWSFMLLAPVIYLSSFPYACLPAAIQTVSPNQMRGQISAIYMLISNLIGIGAGPVVVAVLTDRLFQDEGALNYSLVITCGIAAPLAALFFRTGYKGLRQSIEASQKW